MASLSNINGLFDVHSTGAILFSTSHGTSGQILRSNGNAAPTWVAASTVIGGPYLPLTGGTLSGPLSGTSATFSGTLTVGGNNVVGFSGSWNGADMPGSRWNGYSVNGGEVVFQRDNPNSGQMSILVDGGYYAGENNGFYSLYSSNSYNSKAGFYADTSGVLQFNAPATFTGLVSGITPTAAANFVTKAYADGLTPGAGVFLPLAGGTVTGSTDFTAGTYPLDVYGIGSTAGSSAVGLGVYGSSSDGAIMHFHRPGAYAVNFGLDSDNILRIGGWSAAANRWTLDMSGNNTVAGSFTTTAIKTNIYQNTSGNILFSAGNATTGASRSLNLRHTSGDPSSSDDSNSTGITWGQRTDSNPYYIIYPNLENWSSSGNYSKLTLAWHTGIKIGADKVYGGTRFYNQSPDIAGAAVIMNVGVGNDNIGVINALTVGGEAGIGTTVTTGGFNVNNANSGSYYNMSNNDSGNFKYTNPNGRLLTSNGAGWVGDGRDPILTLSSAGNGGATTVGYSIGLNLYSDTTTNNTYSPLICFSNQSNSGNYATAYAAIGGKKVGAGTDSNWSTGELHFWTAGPTASGSASYMQQASAMMIDDAGAVGIGTNVPVSKLEVNGSIKVTGVTASIGSAGGMSLSYDSGINYINTWASTPLITSTYNYQAFHISGSECMRIHTNGNVGINTTVFPSSGFAKLVVNGGAIAARPAGVNDYFSYIKSNWSSDDAMVIGIEGAGTQHKFITSGNYYYGTELRLWTSDTRRVTIDSQGDVGIGTTSPTSKLHVFGGSANTELKVTTNDNYIARIGMYEEEAGASHGGFIQYRGELSDRLEFGSKNSGTDTVHMSISDLYGNVGIGTAPNAGVAGDRLKIQGGNNGLGCIKAISGQYSYGVRIEGSNLSTQLALYTSSTSQTTQINFEVGGNSSAGKITTTTNTTTYTTNSDYRLKENVIPISDSIYRLNQLKPSRFNFIEEPGKIVDGFIAHEVQDIVPEAIVGEKDEIDKDGNPVHQGIDQAKLVPLLVAAIQELEARVKELENK